MWSWKTVADVLPDLLAGIGVALEALFLGMLLALAVGLVFAVLRRARSSWISRPTAGVVEFIRSTPLLVQLYFLYFSILPAVGLAASPLLTGVFALGLHYGTYTSEVYRAGINGVPVGQWEAARALGLSRFQVYRHVVLPQAIPPVIPALGNYLIAMLKDTPLLLSVTLVEALNAAMSYGGEHFRYLEPLTLAGLLYLGLALLLGLLVGHLERRMRVERVT